ncbi:hypothetical protein D915_009204 [Fasciola hepatica]|uniref:Myotubularin phosphatase domain-containing protein n=1 Tax=Fasciola hepatica TaxID=6192 RepID=A0A4E0RT55_FASHE|nr:hypothetical protein D915_009204 [Fasciola hepatica]
MSSQILLEALRRTEPGFQRLWVSGLPGSIPFAAVDYLLTVDRHERVYKFDPITNMWSSSLDGARPTPSARFFRSSADIPHTPVRLLVFTTSLEVYAFRLCASGFSFEPTETRSKDEAKRTLHKFLNLFTARLHYIRAGSGISLAENYLVQLCLSKITKEQLNSQNPESTIAPSINPFQLSETEAVEDTDDNISPVNNYPVHPGERARHRWCQLPGEHDWIENPDFSFCRTYPLSVPSVRFQRPLIEMRQFFDGFRFPVLSCYYVNAQMNNKNSSTNASGSVNIDPDKRTQISNNDIKRTPSVISSPVRLLRSGQFNASLSLDSFLNSYITKPIGGSVRSRRSRLTRVVRIRLHETDMETIRNSSDSFLPIDTGPTNEISGLMSQLCLSDSVSLSATSSTSGASSRSSWYIPLTSGPPEEKDSNLFVPSRPPSSVKHTHSLYCSTNSLGSEFSWCAPNSQAIQKSWLRLGSLIRLSQLHVPTSETTAAETQNGQSSWSGRRSVGAVSMFDIHTVESDNLPTTPANQCPLWLDEACQPVQMSASQTLLHCFLPNRERTTSQDEPSSSRALRLSIGNLSRSTRSNGADTSSDTASLLAGNKSRLSLRTSLSALAMHRAVHRSDWHANLIDTKWLDLVLFALKQANQLARLLIQMSSSSIRTYISSPTDGNSSFTGTVLVLTGPGSGRTWQPLLTSLTQLILCPETRSLSGFEDLIEREWVRYGYPFAPDPPDWHDTAVAADYDAGATFALFLDCVHQMLYQFPAEFAFTEVSFY